MVQLQALWGVGGSTRRVAGAGWHFVRGHGLEWGQEAVRPSLGVKPSQTQPELPGRASYVICGGQVQNENAKGPLLKNDEGFHVQDPPEHGGLCDCAGGMLMKSPLLPGLKGRPSVRPPFHPPARLLIPLCARQGFSGAKGRAGWDL